MAARAKIVDCPYFKSHDDDDDNVTSRLAKRAKAIGDKLVREARGSSPGPNSRNVSVSPPPLRRNADLVGSHTIVPDAPSPSPRLDVILNSQSLPTSPLPNSGTLNPRDPDLLQVNNPKLSRGLNDDNNSIISEETGHSGSTGSRSKRQECWVCGYLGQVYDPLTKCSTCPKLFHLDRIDSKPCDV